MQDSSQPVVVVADHICRCSSSQSHQRHHTCFVSRLCAKEVAKNGFMYQCNTVTKYTTIYRLGLGKSF